MWPYLNPMTVFACLFVYVCVCIRDDDEAATSANTQNVTDYKTLKCETQACSSMSHKRTHTDTCTQTQTAEMIGTTDYWH